MVFAIKGMRLLNFGKIQDLEVEFSPVTTVIAGANGTGKTTIADAFSWVLTDKLMNGNTADVYPHDEQGNPTTKADTFVTLYADIDGKEYLIEKQLHKALRGNESTFSINGTQMTSKAFKTALTDILGVTQEQLGYCISASHFLKNDTAKRKAALMELVEVETDERLADDNEQFKDLCPMLWVADVDTSVKALRADLNGRGKSDKGLNGKLDGIAERTDELHKMQEHYPKSKYVKARLAELETEKKETVELIVKTERLMDLFKQFSRFKTELYEQKVNELFSIVRFSFSELTLGGDPKDICDITYKGERHGKRLSAGEKLTMECDLVAGLQNAYGLTMPLFVDNSECLTTYSIDAIKRNALQIIALTAKDVPLTVQQGI